MRSFRTGDRVVVKGYGSPYWNNQAGLVLSYTANFYHIKFDSPAHDVGGFSSEFLELEDNDADFIEDLV